MLGGKLITLRPVEQSDLEAFYAFHADIDNRGLYFPRNIVGKSSFEKLFNENGMWSREEGTLLITVDVNRVIGHIEFFKTVNYLDEHELSYLIYDPVDRGKGFATEAVNLLVRYLFETRQMNRIRLVIHPDNVASRRLADRCGFRHEGTARGAWFNAGRHQDVEIYAVLRSEALPA